MRKMDYFLVHIDTVERANTRCSAEKERERAFGRGAVVGGSRRFCALHYILIEVGHDRLVSNACVIAHASPPDVQSKRENSKVRRKPLQYYFCIKKSIVLEKCYTVLSRSSSPLASQGEKVY